MSEDYERTHAERYRLSLEMLRPHLRPDLRVLDLGDGKGGFLAHLRPLVAKVDSYPADLREPFVTALGPYDLVLCMEVIEHIHDREAHPFATEWWGTGTANLMAESFRVLNPGGRLFLTTPNACSLNAIAKAMTMAPPAVYRPHVREYAPQEIVAMLKAPGFEIESFTTCDPWGGGVNGKERSALAQFISKIGWHSPHRGEDMMVLARKP
jgi:SAM-dependent methyltransferase